MRRNSITQKEHDDFAAKIEQMKLDIRNGSEVNVESLLSMTENLLGLVDVYGIAPYDPQLGDYKLCICGHHYHRHFDSYEDMLPVGCKYCECGHQYEDDDKGFVEATPEQIATMKETGLGKYGLV